MSGLLDFEEQVSFCRAAEASGVESLLMAFGFYRPDPMTLSMALAMRTERIKFMVAVRPGVTSPTSFVQQVNTVSALSLGRICINVVTGNSPQELHYYGIFLDRDQRYERADEFLSVCHAFWRQNGEVTFNGKYYTITDGKLNTPFVSNDRQSPEIFLGGNSEFAEQLAIKHAHCLWRFADTPENLRDRVMPVIEQGKEVGLLVSILARPTREEALHDAYAMVETLSARPQRVGKEFAQKTDSVAYRSTYELAEKSESDWLTPCLWAGAIPHLGSAAIALVGTPDEIATAIMEYKAVGISQFLFLSWPAFSWSDIDEVTYFGREVLPLVRKKEQEAESINQAMSLTRTL
jgi:alkanesulfonate monooxygenase